MALGPYPIGDPAGMRAFATFLRQQATTVGRLSRSAAEGYADVPIEAPFMFVGHVRMLATGAAVGVAVEQLHSLADRVSREATSVEDAQRAWDQLKDRLDAEAAAAAAAAAEQASPS